ncbi:hypothetical protein LOZ12_000415 [Ophidiomyces ophidiicola]|uniref:Uncharacterized protein n=1 Tax=Ophidiomyces ophidiicola TaxID=1387563 RepID=A0ACB8UZR2_9EURO|nr:uncharacterized protein LOZ57_002564 [Ophidiomyces ophidiicola]KAI1919548.1 hypothetical protein LOZ64_002245 [Ophidiomyces ophidiicola]KAI1949194.1 hypothetical protein LOZ57_002564 [Ophidiomyces ophidiicola]KAI1955271.1 hypothetical protein LOZ62_000397 [Ophidiomyces ophidiicola]KAI1967422.1 hypothetical protein LOZ59_000792 [Ophidiomyces ophidiicola]KAI1974749.1 hypothetical protein LOZ56_001049 [Ophidiomyces ophidiicola]
MRLELQPLLDSDFPEMVSAQWTSFENPYSGLLRVVGPIFNGDRAASLATNVTVQLAQHKSTPESNWVKVVDADAGNKLAGAARWLIFEHDPFEKPEIVADWWPEATIGREFATRVLLQLEEPRKQRARRPHLYLHIAFTLPEYRGHGVARMFIQWGTQKADAMGLECWLDASDNGRPVYPKYGFIEVLDFCLDPDMDEDAMSEAEREELRELRDLVIPTHLTCMWRPKGGKYVEGVTIKPWEMDSKA